MTPEETVNLLKSINLDLYDAVKRLDARLTFLKSIFGTGEKHNNYSDEFHDAAYKEYKKLCLVKSELMKAIRKEEENA